MTQNKTLIFLCPPRTYSRVWQIVFLSSCIINYVTKRHAQPWDLLHPRFCTCQIIPSPCPQVYYYFPVYLLVYTANSILKECIVRSMDDGWMLSVLYVLVNVSLHFRFTDLTNSNPPWAFAVCLQLSMKLRACFATFTHVQSTLRL